MIPEKREADVFEIENLRIRKRIYKSEKAAALSVPAHDVKVDMSGAVLDVDANKRFLLVSRQFLRSIRHYDFGDLRKAPYCVKGFFPIKSRFFNLTVLNE